MTEAEIISYLERTQLPTVLVEGKDDASIYRWIEKRLGVMSGSVLICSGRDVLLSIYRKRHQFSHASIAWLADRDMWLYTCPPEDLGDVVFTAGYSIENDVYAGSEIESLLDGSELDSHRRLLATLSRWFAFEVAEFRGCRETRQAIHINRIVDFGNMDLIPAFIVDRGYSEPDAAIVNDVLTNYKLYLRGKTLLQAIVHFLSESNRTPKYSHAAVLDMSLRLYPANPYIKRIVQEVQYQLSPDTKQSPQWNVAGISG